MLLRLALAMLAIAAATILGALAFEHIGGYLPCALCLMQRTPYYVGVPLAALALVAAWRRAPRAVLVDPLRRSSPLLMLYSGGLARLPFRRRMGLLGRARPPARRRASRQAWRIMLTQLETTHAPSCTEATWRLLGLSFAGWNVLVSALLAALGLYGALLAWRGRRATQ